MNRYIARLADAAVAMGATAIHFSASDRKLQQHLENNLKPEFDNKPVPESGLQVSKERLAEIAENVSALSELTLVINYIVDGKKLAHEFENTPPRGIFDGLLYQVTENIGKGTSFDLTLKNGMQCTLTADRIMKPNIGEFFLNITLP